MWLQILTAVLSAGAATTGIRMIFMLGRVYERFEQLDARVEKLEHRIFGSAGLASGVLECESGSD